MLHILTDDSIVARPDFIPVAESLLRVLGPRGALHLRVRMLHGGAYLALTNRLATIAHEVGACLVVNDRVDIALSAGASAVQLGRSAMSASEVHRIAPSLKIGVSIHEVHEVDAASGIPRNADWILAGHVFKTNSHPDTPPRGIPFIRAVAEATHLPIIAVGGITPDRVPQVIEAGVTGVAAISGIWDAKEPTEAASDYLSMMSLPQET